MVWLLQPHINCKRGVVECWVTSHFEGLKWNFRRIYSTFKIMDQKVVTQYNNSNLIEHEFRHTAVYIVLCKKLSLQLILDLISFQRVYKSVYTTEFMLYWKYGTIIIPEYEFLRFILFYKSERRDIFNF